jgi:hypoxanthine phosphoribosyltransferase
MEDNMKAIRFLGLCGLVAVLSCSTADVNATTYGKMNHGIGYTEAQAGDDAARAKAAEARALATKINQLSSALFNALPVEMSREDFVYELLNWPDDVIDGSHNAKISEEMRIALMGLALNDGRDEAVDLRGELRKRVILGKKVLLANKVSDSRATKEAVADVLDRFMQLDDRAVVLLRNMGRDIIHQENAADGKDPIAKFTAKIAVIQEYIPQFRTLYEESQIDFDTILTQKRQETHQSAIQHHAQHGIRRAAPDDVVLSSPQNRISVSARGSIASKRAMLQVLLTHVTSTAEQLTILDEYNRLNDEQFIQMWNRLGRIMKDYSELDEDIDTPRMLFSRSKLLRFACRRDMTMRTRLYNELDRAYPRVTRGAGKDADLDARSVVPNPAVEDWANVTDL